MAKISDAALQIVPDMRAQMSAELFQAFDILNTNINAQNSLPGRQCAELREARRILLQLKQADMHMPNTQEIGWALQQIIAVSEMQGLRPVAISMRKVALMLAIDVTAPQCIPGDLDNKIANAMKALRSPVSPQLAAVG